MRVKFCGLVIVKGANGFYVCDPKTPGYYIDPAGDKQHSCAGCWYSTILDAVIAVARHVNYMFTGKDRTRFEEIVKAANHSEQSIRNILADSKKEANLYEIHVLSCGTADEIVDLIDTIAEAKVIMTSQVEIDADYEWDGSFFEGEKC